MPARHRLLMVSNRAPVKVRRTPEGPRAVRTVGGLASALTDALRERDGAWVAWTGPGVGEEIPAGTAGLAVPIRAVRLKEREVGRYYAGFANQGSWPLCQNPYDTEAVRRGLDVAVAMPAAERKRRTLALNRRVAEHDLHWWTTTFLERLDAVSGPTASAA